MRVVERFADFVISLPEVDRPSDLPAHAVRAVVDWFAATLPGTVLPPATSTAKALFDEVGHGPATLLGSTVPATAQAAALINGTAAHIVEFDDIFREGLYHPGAPTIAAALAAAELADADGSTFLDGVIAGYEVSNRIAMAVNPRHYDYWHTTATVGCFGAAAAAASILRLTKDETAHALATAGTMAAGLQQAFRADAMSKPLHSGRAAEAGLIAARMAQQGVTGALDILEGPAGFAAAMSGEVDWQPVLDTLGHRWTIAETTVKNHAACGHVHAAVDAALALQSEHGFADADVARIEVASYAKSLEICGNATPKTAFEAKFSLPYCIAAALVTGAVRVKAFSDATLAEPRIRALAEKVEHSVDPDCEAPFPKARSARVAIHLKDGKRLDRFAPTRKGDPDDPLTDAELDEKFFELTEPVLNQDAGPLLARLRHLGPDANIRDLMRGVVLRQAAE